MKLYFQELGLAFFLSSALSCLAAPPAPAPRLTGIVCLGESRRALLELRGESSGSPEVRRPILKVGERDGDASVIAIDETSARVTLRQGPKEVIELHLDLAPGEEMANRTLNFQSANLEQALDIYQEVAGRTVVRPSTLPLIMLDVKSGPSLSQPATAAVLDKVLTERGLLLRPQGDKFVFVVLAAEAERLSRIPPLPAPGSRSGTESIPGELIPSGVIKFQGSDVLQVLDIYQELTGRTVLRPSRLPSGKISLRSQTPITEKEAVWLLDASLSLAGIAMLPESAKFVFAVANSMTNNLPKFHPSTDPEKAGTASPPGALKFQDAPISMLLEIYASLVGREPILAAPSVSSVRFSLRSQHALSHQEAIFALEAVAALNNLKLEFVGDNEVKTVPRGQR